jgi:hypothetical protein
MMVFFILMFSVISLLLAPPTFISNLFDGDSKRKKKDWTEDED